MKRFLQLLALVAALSVGWAANAQTRTVFSTGTSTSKWKTITNTTDLLGSGDFDYRASTVREIGFVFPLGTQQYSQFSVNSDGNLRLGSVVTGMENYTLPFSSVNDTVNSPKINFLGCDGYHLDSIHYVRAQNYTYWDNGAQPMLVVEFCLGTFNSVTRRQKYKWQVHLYANGNIEVVFPSTVPSQGPAVTHQKGFTFYTGEGYIVNSSNGAIHFSSSNGSTTTWAAGTWPEANRYYQFKRMWDYSITPYTNWMTRSDSTNTDADHKKWYVTNLIAGYQYTFKTGCGDGATADFDIELWLYDANGNLLANNDDGCEQGRSKLTFAPQQTGYYYLKVGEGIGDANGHYTLAYRKECVEIPNYHATITPTSSWSTVSGTTTSTCLQRIYRLPVEAGYYYHFKTDCSISAEGDITPSWSIVNVNGQEADIQSERHYTYYCPISGSGLLPFHDHHPVYAAT